VMEHVGRNGDGSVKSPVVKKLRLSAAPGRSKSTSLGDALGVVNV
jgi:hypothetical protein